MAHGSENAVLHLARIEMEEKVEAFAEMPGGEAVPQQYQQQHEQQRHHDAQAALQSGHHTFGDDECGPQHEQAVPQGQPPRVGGQATKRRTGTIGADTGKVAAAHAKDVIQRPARHYAVEGQDQQCGDHPHQCRQRPALRCPGLDRQALHRVDRALPTAATDQGLRQHDRHAHQGDAEQVHHDECTAAVDARHVGKLPDIAEAYGRTGGCQNEHPTTGPRTMN